MKFQIKEVSSKTNIMIYWISTFLTCLFLLFSAYTYFFSKPTFEGVKALGFPDFFIYQLAILKIVAVVVILTPTFPMYCKEWAYAGVMLFYITALVAHIVHKDSIAISIMLIILMIILSASYVTNLNRI
jgi:hypothetical protein